MDHGIEKFIIVQYCFNTLIQSLLFTGT